MRARIVLELRFARELVAPQGLNMNRTITTVLAATLAILAALPTMNSPVEARNRGAKIAAGVVLGAAALAIIAGSGRRARADNYDDGRRDDWRRRCSYLYSRCNDGSRWACEKFETSGCSE